MANKLKKENSVVRMGKMIFLSMFVAILVAAILLLITAAFLDKLNLSEKQVRLMVYVIYICSALASGVSVGKWKREKKFLWGAIAGGVWMLLILVVSLISNGTSIEVKELFPAAVCMVGSGMLGGMLA